MAWMPWSLEASAYAMTFGVKSQQILLAGTANGYVRKEESGDFTDYSGTAGDHDYEYFIKTGDFDFGLPNQDKIFRAVTIATSGIVGDVALGARSIEITPRGEFDRTTGAAADLAIEAGGFILDFTALPGVLLDNPRFTEKRQPIALRAKHFNLTVTGSGKTNGISIAGLAVEWFPATQQRKILVSSSSM
jgi:hypothetical protein